MTLKELVAASDGMPLVDEDGEKDRLRLSPPATAAEIAALEVALPCPIPPHVRELLALTRGFENGPLESIDFAGLPGGFGIEEIFPHALALAHDGAGNYWVADLQPESKDWAPIYFACHDPPVIAFQSATFEQFVTQFLAYAKSPEAGEIDQVQTHVTADIWSHNPGTLAVSDACSANDEDLRAFAASLDDSYAIIDLRTAKVGDGFSWGRYGPRTKVVRYGHHPIFAYQAKSRWQRMFGR